MSTYKRRIVYLSDEEWTELGRVAKDRKITISATVRRMLEPAQLAEGVSANAPNAQAARDDLLRKINRSR